MTHYHGGMLVTITTNLDKMTRTAREMAEVQVRRAIRAAVEGRGR